MKILRIAINNSFHFPSYDFPSSRKFQFNYLPSENNILGTSFLKTFQREMLFHGETPEKGRDRVRWIGVGGLDFGGSGVWADYACVWQTKISGENMHKSDAGYNFPKSLKSKIVKKQERARRGGNQIETFQRNPLTPAK